MATRYYEQGATYDEMRSPTWWQYRWSWKERYEAAQHWRCMIAGTTTRYEWLAARGRLPTIWVQ